MNINRCSQICFQLWRPLAWFPCRNYLHELRMSSHCSHKFTWTLEAMWLNQWLEIYGYHSDSSAFPSICVSSIFYFLPLFFYFSPLSVFFILVSVFLSVAMTYYYSERKVQIGIGGQCFSVLLLRSCSTHPSHLRTRLMESVNST